MAKMRSPNYPAIGLSQAIEHAKALWEKEQRTAVSPEVAVKAFGYKGMSGPARTVLSALRKYGLVQEDRSGVRLSDLGLRLVVGRPEDEAYRRALVEAAMKPDLFVELAKTHADGSDDNLRHHLIVQRGFSEAGARQLIGAFRDTMSLAKPSEMAHNVDRDISGGDVMDAASGVQAALVSGQTGKVVQRVFSWPLGKGVLATLDLRIPPGSDLKKSQIEMLRQYVEMLAKSELESDPT